ncbi:hypothetical protein A5635_04175 [Mycobacterium asiaticum]|uniref:ESX-1 secretion-associated protein n=1 Tax=Mycobacterium asiaticum TaxID=1790 RepID=A0A1A3ULF7_MYCAS|nr:hypothetical protein A5635_04175 [Mycobacterium asiaticum]OBK95928.1 hypothetical protein A5645_11250 [Mycobacterium asiaticum]
MRANPDVLSHIGNQLADHGQSLLAVQQLCHDDADGAQRGWVGSSAAALTGLLDRWAAAGVSHLHRIAEHADGMRTAAAECAELDQRNAASLR